MYLFLRYADETEKSKHVCTVINLGTMVIILKYICKLIQFGYSIWDLKCQQFKHGLIFSAFTYTWFFKQKFRNKYTTYIYVISFVDSINRLENNIAKTIENISTYIFVYISNLYWMHRIV